MPPQAKAALDAFSSEDKEYHEFPIGHGGLVFGKVARKTGLSFNKQLAGGQVRLIPDRSTRFAEIDIQQ